VLTPIAPVRVAVAALVAVTVAVGLGGCSKFDSAFGQQWIMVTFAPNTTVATAKRVVTACGHVPNMPLMGKVKPDTGQSGVVDDVQFNATKATPAQMARLEQCLSKFPAIVQGFTEMDQGDSE
jgi:hypothetical protein